MTDYTFRRGDELLALCRRGQCAISEAMLTRSCTAGLSKFRSGWCA
jgi:hypothetical protein